MSGIASSHSATAAGSASMNARRSPQSSSDEYSSCFASAVMLRERRQEHGAERDAEQRAGKLHQPVGIGDPRDRARRRASAASCVLMSAEICAADTPITRGPHRAAARGARLRRASRSAAAPACRSSRSGRICSASCATPPMNTPHASALIGGSQYGARNSAAPMIETLSSTGVNGGNRELPVDVEHAARERHQRHEEEVRKHDADHLRGQLDLARRARESRRRARRRATARPARRASVSTQQHHGEQRADAADERARLVVAALPPVFGEDRHEGLRERAFGEQPPQDVGQAERRLERVHLHPGAERRRLQAFADEPGDARQERHAADGGQRPQEVQCLLRPRCDHRRAAAARRTRRNGVGTDIGAGRADGTQRRGAVAR